MAKVSEVTIVNGLYLLLIVGLMSQVRRDLSSNFVELERCYWRNSRMIDHNCSELLEEIRRKVIKEPKYVTWERKALEAQRIVLDLVRYVDTLQSRLLLQMNSPGHSYADRLVFCTIDAEGMAASGCVGSVQELLSVIDSTRSSLLRMVDNEDDLVEFGRFSPLQVDFSKSVANSTRWSSRSFNDVPVAGVKALLAKIVFDAKCFAFYLLQYFEGKTWGGCNMLDRHIVLFVAQRQHLFSGQGRFCGNIIFGEYVPSWLKICYYVDGKPLQVIDQCAKYEGAVENGIGERVFKVRAWIENPLTESEYWVDGMYHYSVGRSSVSVIADKMQVFYVGVDHHLSIGATDFGASDLVVTAEGAGASIRQEGSAYLLTATETGICKVLVKTPDYNFPMEFTYRVKACPNPLPVVGHLGQKSFEATEFHVLDSLSAQLTEFDFAKECYIVSFNLTKVGRRADPIEAVNDGGLFSSETKGIIQSATSGDSYLFTAIKAKCTGDRVSREIGSLCASIR